MSERHDRLAGSRALWNRDRLDLRSDEILAQIMDRGTVEDWRDLYKLALEDAGLRRRMLRVVREVPLPLPRFWLAALGAAGEDVDLGMDLPAARLDV